MGDGSPVHQWCYRCRDFWLTLQSVQRNWCLQYWAVLVCAVTVFIIILYLAEVSSRFDKTGRPYVYARSSLGQLTGFVTGWLLLLTRFITYAALANLLVTYLSFFSEWFAQPIPRTVTITVITLLLAFINHVGVKNSTRVNIFLTIEETGKPGSFSSISDDKNNIHWLVATTEKVFTFDVIVTKLHQKPIEIDNIDIYKARKTGNGILKVKN